MTGPRRWTLPLFLFLAVLHIAPVWSVRYFPTGDGATHVYNAWVLHELAGGTAPRNIAQAYRIDWTPHPNWTGHAFMALAMILVPPIVAEKLLLTLIFIALFAGAWSLCTAVDPRSDVYAFFVFPFAYAQHLLSGYYNYSLSIGLFLIILATWWRRRENPSARTIAIISSLLVLCYFTHPMATLLACGAMAMLSILSWRPAHLFALLPVAPLLSFFGRSPESGADAPLDPSVNWVAARLLGSAEIIQSLGMWQREIGLGVALLFAVFAAITIVRDRDRDREANVLAAVALAFAALMFWLPAPEGTRALFTQRTSQFFYPLLAAWLTPRIGTRARISLVGVLTLLIAANSVVIWKHVLTAGAENARYVRTFDALEPEKTMLPLLFNPPESGTTVPLFIHRISYVALEKRLVDYANYEPNTRYFPIAWREPVDTTAIELFPHTIGVGDFARRAEYVVTQALPAGSEQQRDLQRFYSLVREHGDLRIHRRHPVLGEWDLVLLPLLGTRRNLGAPGGARWRIDQRVSNRGKGPVRVIFRDCLEDWPCDFTVHPGQSVPVATAARRFALLEVPRGTWNDLEITTVVRRADVDLPELSIHVPAAHERDFRKNRLRIEAVRARDHKVGLRLYLLSDPRAVTIRVRSRQDGTIVGEQTAEIAGWSLYEKADLSVEFPGFNARAESVDIEIESHGDARIWAFATSAGASGRTQVCLPARQN